MDEVDEIELKKEAKFWATLNHPNIVKIKCKCFTESCIMTETMSSEAK